MYNVARKIKIIYLKMADSFHVQGDMICRIKFILSSDCHRIVCVQRLHEALKLYYRGESFGGLLLVTACQCAMRAMDYAMCACE